MRSSQLADLFLQQQQQQRQTDRVYFKIFSHLININIAISLKHMFPNMDYVKEHKSLITFLV